MTMTGQGTAASQQQAALAAIKNYLMIAPTKYWATTGSTSATANAVVNWVQQLPIIPSFCTGIDYTITLPVTLTLGASTGSATLSEFAPYCAVQQQLTIGGAPPWPMTELTPWYMDQVIHKINFDPNYPGYGDNASYWATITDQGSTVNKIGGSGSLSPSTTVTNTTTAATNTNYTWTFKVRQQFQRKRQLLWGAVPFGDPENRPYNAMQVGTLLGVNPEQNLFTGAAGTGTACVLQSAGMSVVARYSLAYVDLLPPGMTAPPQPTVGYGLQMVPFSTTGLSAGVINPITHRTAMLYTHIHQLLINNQLPVQADYFGLWDDQDQQSSRWNYDLSQNTFQTYFDKFHRVYRHYPLVGQYVCDFEGGEFPEIPSVTPLDAVMSPDASYAATFGVPVTPAMTTAIRLPSGDTATNCYIRTYAFGLVRVPY
jgi:hypothetical protein